MVKKSEFKNLMKLSPYVKIEGETRKRKGRNEKCGELGEKV